MNYVLRYPCLRSPASLQHKFSQWKLMPPTLYLKNARVRLFPSQYSHGAPKEDGLRCTVVYHNQHIQVYSAINSSSSQDRALANEKFICRHLHVSRQSSGFCFLTVIWRLRLSIASNRTIQLKTTSSSKLRRFQRLSQRTSSSLEASFSPICSSAGTLLSSNTSSR